MIWRAWSVSRMRRLGSRLSSKMDFPVVFIFFVDHILAKLGGSFLLLGSFVPGYHYE
jgi:hypothetical protein